MKTIRQFVYFALPWIVPAVHCSAQATTIIGSVFNGIDFNDSVTVRGPVVSPPQQEYYYAFSFDMGQTSYEVSSLILRLTGYRTGPPEDEVIPRIQFFLDSGSDSPGSPVGERLTNPPDDANPGSNAFYSFTPPSQLILEAETRYWLVVGSDLRSMGWRGQELSADPAGAGATFHAYGQSEAGIWTVPSTHRGWFDLQGTAVPEASPVLLILSITVPLAHRRARRKNHVHRDFWVSPYPRL